MNHAAILARRRLAMKPENSSEDETLSRVLHSWRTESPLPPRFDEGVWKKIERAERPGAGEVWSVLRTWIAGALQRPSLAVSYVALLLLLGLAAGFWQGHAGSQRAAERLSAQYVQAVDPYQMPR